jgi:hypothetical protein
LTFEQKILSADLNTQYLYVLLPLYNEKRGMTGKLRVLEEPPDYDFPLLLTDYDIIDDNTARIGRYHDHDYRPGEVSNQ